MGIRIQKIMGYGLVDIETKDDKITDNRFNPMGIMLKNIYDQEKEYTTEAFLSHCDGVMGKKNGNMKFDLKLLKLPGLEKHKLKDVLRMLTYDEEFGFPDVMCVTPFTSPTWERSDDNIDYYTQHARHQYFNDPQVDVLTIPLYPYDGYINMETGERADNIVREMIHVFRRTEIDLQNKPNLSEKETSKLYDDRETALSQLGCKIHWTEKWNVMIPEQVIEFCRFTKMFKDDKTIWTLRPMIYTYWT